MTNEPAKKFDDYRKEFEEQQASRVDELFNANPEKVDVAKAKEVGLISKEVKDEVVEGLGEFFKAALRREKREAGSRPDDPSAKAFKIAFEAVYGRFLFAKAEADVGGAAVKKLAEKAEKEDVLKTPLKTGADILKGRPELIAALRRLKNASNTEKDPAAADKYEKDVIDEAFKAESGADIKGLERVHEEASAKQKSIRGTYEYFSHSENVGGFLEKHNAYKKVVEGAKDKLEVTYEPYSDTDGHLSNFVIPVIRGRGSVENASGTGNKSFHEKRAEVAGNLAAAESELKRLNVPGPHELKNYMDSFRYAESQNQEIPPPEKAMEKLVMDYNTNKGRYTKAKAKYEEESRVYETIFTFADQLYTELKKLVQNVEAAHKLEMDFGGDFEAKRLVEEFEMHGLKNPSFDPIEFMNFSEKLSKHFGNTNNLDAIQKAFDAKSANADKETKKAKKSLDDAKKIKEKTADLTDAQAAKRIMETVLLKKFPGMPAADRSKLAAMILTEDVMRLQQAGTYEEIAREGGADFFDTAELAGFREKLIGFEFKVGDAATQPFKGLKPSDFADNASIERLFKSGRLNHQNGFFALAALELFEGGSSEGGSSEKVVFMQSVVIKKRLKELLARKMGVEDNLSDSRVAGIINRAFDEQLEHVRPVVTAYFEAHDKGASGFSENKIIELNAKMERLREERRLGKVSDKAFERQKGELLKEAKESGLDGKVEFSEDSVVADWFASPDSEWLRGMGHDVKQWFGAKGKGLGGGIVDTAVSGAWGATKLAASLGWQAALTPLRVVKYAGLTAAKLPIGAINLFRKSKWTPLPKVRDTLRADFGRTLAYGKDVTAGTVKRAYDTTGAHLKKGLAAAPDKHKPYKDRTKKSLEAMEGDIKTAAGKAKASAVGVAESPYLSFGKYVKELKDLGFGAEVPKDPVEHKSEEPKRSEAGHDKKAA